MAFPCPHKSNVAAATTASHPAVGPQWKAALWRRFFHYPFLMCLSGMMAGLADNENFSPLHIGQAKWALHHKGIFDSQVSLWFHFYGMRPNQPVNFSGWLLLTAPNLGGSTS